MLMRKAVIFGAGAVGRYLCGLPEVKSQFDELIFVDNNYRSFSEVLSPDILTEIEFDKVIIATESESSANSIYNQLINEFALLPNQIDCKTRLYGMRLIDRLLVRNCFLEQFSKHVYSMSYQGNVAEVGVFQGHFAKEINNLFPDRKFYLFDTFEGFDNRDIQQESKKNNNYDNFQNWVESTGKFADTNVETVIRKLPYPQNCTIIKGYFPETFDVFDEEFCFVNLDVDLFSPTKAGLKIFYPQMCRGGVILVHDYFSLDGVKSAVDEFIREHCALCLPVGDELSIAIVKQ
jgi:hypothetical protein